VSVLSLLIALSALGWQVAKHFLDGGRVKVYLNTAIWEPGIKLTTNRSGKLILKADDDARSVTHGRALELAQLVVENPGRTAVTVYSPGLSISGHGIKHHSLVPRMFSTDASFGPDNAVTDTVVRLEPYARVTFLLDYWSVMPGILKDTQNNRVFVRGFVGVAGRTKRPQLSSRRLRWRIGRGAYTAIQGSPELTPFAVLWRELFVRLPTRIDDDPDRHPNSGKPITRGTATYLLDEAMSRFDDRPELDDLKAVLDEIAQRKGDRVPMLGINAYWGYEALVRMEGHLTPWAEGLFHRREREKRVATDEENRKDAATPVPETGAGVPDSSV
jgi:hypothetical protein